MKTDSTKLFDEMLKDNMDSPGDLNESQKLEQQLNETIKASVEKMQETINKRLNDVETNVNNIMKEKGEKEHGNKNNEESNTGSNESNDISPEEES